MNRGRSASALGGGAMALESIGYIGNDREANASVLQEVALLR